LYKLSKHCQLKLWIVGCYNVAMFCILLVVWFVTKNKLYIGIPLSFKSGHNLEVNNILNNGNIYLAEHFSLELSILINYF